MTYMDIDNFKGVNDRFGHQTGNNLLRLVAHRIKANVREVDTVARLGGDEFAILLTETGSESAQAVFRKLQKDLLEAMQENKWPVTFSMGAVTFMRPPIDVEEMIKKADELMYMAKKSGKNTIKHEVLEE